MWGVMRRYPSAHPAHSATTTTASGRHARVALVCAGPKLKTLAHGEDRDSMRAMTKAAACTAIVGAIAVVATGCGGSSTSTTASTSTTSSTSTSSSPLTISTAQVAGLGTVLVNSQGRTLYMFAPDHQNKVTCVGPCAAVWPPVLLAAPSAAGTGGVKSSLLGSDPNPSGGQVVTYNKWPLYTFAGDTSAGAATGQALNLNGGLWYVISPSGALITKKG